MVDEAKALTKELGDPMEKVKYTEKVDSSGNAYYHAESFQDETSPEPTLRRHDWHKHPERLTFFCTCCQHEVSLDLLAGVSDYPHITERRRNAALDILAFQAEKERWQQEQEWEDTESEFDGLTGPKGKLLSHQPIQKYTHRTTPIMSWNRDEGTSWNDVRIARGTTVRHNTSDST